MSHSGLQISFAEPLDVAIEIQRRQIADGRLDLADTRHQADKQRPRRARREPTYRPVSDLYGTRSTLAIEAGTGLLSIQCMWPASSESGCYRIA